MGQFRIIPRSEWGARYSQGNPLNRRHEDVHMHTEAGAVRPADWPALIDLALTVQLNERQRMQAIERYHVVSRGWQGIGYSFVIAFDGSIFEGRGWRRWGGHTLHHNDDLGICFMGHGDLQPATEAQWAAAAWLIREGVRLGHVNPKYSLFGHRDTAPKSCPGNLIYPHLGRLRGLTSTRPVDPPVPPQELFTVSQYDDLKAAVEAAEAEANAARAVALVAVNEIRALRKVVDADYAAQLVDIKEDRDEREGKS